MDNEDCKIERGRRRLRSHLKSKRNRKKRRSGSENGKVKLGNSEKGSFCSYCRPTLTNSLARKFYAKNVLTEYVRIHGLENLTVDNESCHVQQQGIDKFDTPNIPPHLLSIYVMNSLYGENDFNSIDSVTSSGSLCYSSDSWHDLSSTSFSFENDWEYLWHWNNNN